MTAMVLSLSIAPTVQAAPRDFCPHCEESGAGLDGNKAAQAFNDRSRMFRHGGSFRVVSDIEERSSGSSCPGCTYAAITRSELQSRERIPAFPFAACPAGTPGDTRFLYRQRPGTAGQEFLGVVCAPQTGPGQPPITLAMVEAEVRRLVQELVPDSTRLGFAPADGAVVNLPTIVYATPAATVTRDFAPFGIPVSITVVPSWHWTFEPGATRSTTGPGKPYAATGRPVAADPGYVTHSYRTPGERSLGVTVRWDATWRLDGGPSRGLGALTRSDSAAVPVREAPARLVAG